MKNKTFLTIAAAGVAVLLFMRNRKMRAPASQNAVASGFADSVNTTSTAVNININNVDSILNGLDFTEPERSYIRRVNEWVNNSTLYSEDIRRKSVENGVTFAQQVVCDALWLLYIGKNEDGSNYWKNPRGWSMALKVKRIF